MQTAVPLQAFSGSGVLQGLGVGSTAHGAPGRQLMEAHHLEQGSASFSCQGSGSKYLGHMDPWPVFKSALTEQKQPQMTGKWE